ncbi:KH domain-containing protein [Candidatus Giovannonibacteria bacterium]|nr:KH domain-containing protein [Candidatus Giovannonibacteria bacterium]
MAAKEKFTDQEFLDYVVRALVDNSDAVKTERKVDEMGVLLSVLVDKDDVGKLIGRNGNTAKALRTLLRVVGLKNHARVNLKIEEPEGSTHVRAPRPPQTNRSVDDVVDDLKL